MKIYKLCFKYFIFVSLFALFPENANALFPTVDVSAIKNGIEKNVNIVKQSKEIQNVKKLSGKINSSIGSAVESVSKFKEEKLAKVQEKAAKVQKEKDRIEKKQSKLQKLKAEYEEKKKQYEEYKKQAESYKQQYEDAKADIKKQYEEYKKQAESYKQQYEDAKADINEVKSDINDAKAEYESYKSDVVDLKDSVGEMASDAKETVNSKIDDAKEQIPTSSFDTSSQESDYINSDDKTYSTPVEEEAETTTGRLPFTQPTVELQEEIDATGENIIEPVNAVEGVGEVEGVEETISETEEVVVGETPVIPVEASDVTPVDNLEATSVDNVVATPVEGVAAKEVRPRKNLSETSDVTTTDGTKTNIRRKPFGFNRLQNEEKQLEELPEKQSYRFSESVAFAQIAAPSFTVYNNYIDDKYALSETLVDRCEKDAKEFADINVVNTCIKSYVERLHNENQTIVDAAREELNQVLSEQLRASLATVMDRKNKSSNFDETVVEDVSKQAAAAKDERADFTVSATINEELMKVINDTNELLAIQSILQSLEGINSMRVEDFSDVE
ncbi:MAG: hypothetical protein PHE89_02310 [Alphaproteobacteria bacterium]|nr:hypothetical protein [Alphaproteobacteria bacterium]